MTTRDLTQDSLEATVRKLAELQVRDNMALTATPKFMWVPIECYARAAFALACQEMEATWPSGSPKR